MTSLAWNESKLGRPHRGVEILTPAIHTASQILNNIGQLDLHAKKPADALRFLQAAALITPNEEDIIHGIGYALLELRRYREAIPYLKRATKLNPSCESAWYDFGFTLSRLKQNAGARASFRKTLSLNPKHASAYYATACLDALQRKNSSAFKNLDKAIVNGFRDLTHLQRDKDLCSLRRDRRWQAILKKLSAHPGA
jgi:tetratricopeptide (TPR) repeat protein